MTERAAPQLEITVKTLLHHRSLSMRQLGLLTGIHVTTISKMISGKQRVNPDYLTRMARALAVPARTLFEAAGFDMSNPPSQDVGHPSPQPDATAAPPYGGWMRDLLHYAGVAADGAMKEQIEEELDKCEAYARTKEGRALILDRYAEKRQQIPEQGRFVDDLDQIYDQFLRTPADDPSQAILGSALLYFVLSADAIPDYVYPVGYLDDALATQIAQTRLSRTDRDDSATD